MAMPVGSLAAARSAACPFTRSGRLTAAAASGRDYGRVMRPTTKSLPRQDVLSLLDILVVLLGELTAGQLSPDLTARVMRRLVKDRLLAEEASVGELRAVVADLVERLRFALGEYASYPESLPLALRPWPRS
jgi:hypothetical protein